VGGIPAQSNGSVGFLDPPANHTFGAAETLSRGDFPVAMARLSRVLGLNPNEAPAIRTSPLSSQQCPLRRRSTGLAIRAADARHTRKFDVNEPMTGKQAVSIAENATPFFREKAVERTHKCVSFQQPRNLTEIGAKCYKPQR